MARSSKPKLKKGTSFYQDKKGEWRWRIVANNNRIVGASSEGFLSKAKAKRNFGAMFHAAYSLPIED